MSGFCSVVLVDPGLSHLDRVFTYAVPDAMPVRIGSLVRELYAADQRYTVSFGVASYPKHGASAEAVMHAVRHALGEARELGGDRAVTFFSAENSIEERLRSAEIDIEVVAEPRDAATA